MSTSKNVAQSAEIFDFSKTEMPEQSNWLKLGHYWLHVAEAKFEQPEGNNAQGKPKSAFLKVMFRGNAGQVEEKFYISPSEGLMKRLQYLHHALTGKECTKVFKSVKEVGAYYELLLNDSRITSKELAVIVAGTEGNNGKIYGNLPYLHFIIDSDLAKKSGFEEHAFEEGSNNWNNYLKRADKNASHKTEDIMVPADVPPTEDDGLPF